MIPSVQSDLITRLRTEFDRSFTLNTHTVTEAPVELLTFRVGEGKYAARLEHIATVYEIRTVTRIPGQASGLEGLVAVQGQLVTVYDLAVLLRAPGNTISRRWLLVCSHDRQLGFAVDAIDGYVRKSPTALVPASDNQQHHLAVSHALEEESSTRLLVDFTVLLNSLRRDLGLEGLKIR